MLIIVSFFLFFLLPLAFAFCFDFKTKVKRAKLRAKGRTPLRRSPPITPKEPVRLLLTFVSKIKTKGRSPSFCSHFLLAKGRGREERLFLSFIN
jgi:hypothetical protein